MLANWIAPWERDAKGRRLSVIVASDQSFPHIVDRGCDPLRPVFVDGPSIAHAFDNNYHLYDHIFPPHNYLHENVWRTHQTPHRFPVIALVQTLFTFISRGHRTVVLMPSIYDERSANGKIAFDMSQLVDDVQLLRRLIELKLVQFIKDEKNFSFKIRLLTRKSYGALVTCNLIERLDIKDGWEVNKKRNVDSAHKNGRPTGSLKIVNDVAMKENCDGDPETGNTSSKQGEAVEGGSSTNEQMEKMRDEKLPVDFLPIITTVFYNIGCKRQLLIPLDSPCCFGVSPTTKQMLVFQTCTDGDAAISHLTTYWQLTLSKQSRLLEDLDVLLKGQYPRGLREKPITAVVKQMWLATKEMDCDNEDSEIDSTRSSSAMSTPMNGDGEEDVEDMSKLSDVVIFDDDFLDAERDEERFDSETSSVLSDLILLDDDFAATHDLIDL